ncbi:o-acyltransferase [Holotrichia oblita]|uniref:O-acyltransferase n=1 Tax=Holotrichia oblita TaxID=644536 RepID=A0ACB9SUG4_HOLOL|nr:o-acyltransferase [Holotrichia oblita]
MRLLYFLLIFCCTFKIFIANVTNTSDSDGSNPFEIRKFLEFYSSKRLSDSLEDIRGFISPNCSEDLAVFVDALRNGENWALKMDDASGRYSSGWFWGNQYWIGSQGLCENIPVQGQAPNMKNMKGNHTREIREEISPSQAEGYKTYTTSSAPSPYAIGYVTIKIKLNSSLHYMENKKIQLGLCLPVSCQDEDVKRIIEETSTSSGNVHVEILGVKSQQEYFDIFKDITFQILCSVTAIVVILLIAGTSYDFYLTYGNDQRFNCNSMKCTTYTNSELQANDKHIKLNPSNLDVKNNICCLHSLENNNNSTSERPNDIFIESKPMPTKEKLIYSILKDMLLSFSLRTNIKTICDRSVGSDTISSIHGLKVVSMVWVILGHTCIIGFKYSDNMEYRKVVQKEFFFQTISNGAFSVDTFFFTSGFLVSFLYFRTNEKGKLDALGHKGFLAGCAHFLGLVGYRFARLSIPYLVVIGLVEVCMKWFTYNSIFAPPTMDHINCPKYWWRNLLYINTLFPDDQMCMLWSWYLSDDTQFYVLGAILLILATSHFKIAAFSLVAFMLSSWITTGYISIINNHSPSSEDPLALFDKIYDKPWTRLSPYLIGMIVGWILFKKNRRIKISLLANIVGWLASAACLLSLVYGLYEVNLSVIAGAAYSSLSHSVWALGLGWIVVACATGNGGFINSILSATILYPVSRITYCAYLLHPLVMRIMIMHMDYPLHLGKPLMVAVFIGQVVMSYLLGFVLSVVYEAPIVSMLKILTKIPTFGPKRKTTNST